MKAPLVSIIVPNYNHARFLPERLKSIEAQNYPNLEIILLDDASTDQSAEILKDFAQKRAHCRLIVNEKNSGSPFVQWNRGVSIAKGELIWIAESDDYAAPHFLSTLVLALQENKQAGIAYAQSMVVDEASEELHSYEENLRFIYESKAWQQDFELDGPEAIRRWLVHHNPLPNVSGLLIRKSAYEQAGGAPEDMRLNGDWLLYARILKNHRLIFKAEILNYFRQHRSSQRAQARARADVYQELYTLNRWMAEAVPSARVAADQALTKIADWWIGSLPDQARTAENRRLNRKLFEKFAPIRAPLRRRIFFTYLITYLRNFLRFTGLLKPLKSARGKLFPGKYWNQ